MKQPGLGCGVVLRRGDRILLIRRRRAPEAGAWGLVSGKIDFMERAENAARRECLEESGVAVATLSLLGVSEQLMEDEAQHWLSLIYLADDVSGEPILAEPEKHSEIGWFAIDALPLPLCRAVQDAVAFMGSGRNGPAVG